MMLGSEILSNKDAVLSWKTLNEYCKTRHGCADCVLHDGRQCLFDYVGCIGNEPYMEIIEKRCAELEEENE